MTKKVFVDSSAWISYSLSKQPKHSTIVKLIKQLRRNHVVICTSNDVIDETVTRLIYHTDPRIVEKFINFIKQSLEAKSIIQLWVDEQSQNKAFGLVEKFSEHTLSLTDATTVVLMQEFGVESVISLDSDFVKVGVTTLP